MILRTTTLTKIWPKLTAPAKGDTRNGIVTKVQHGSSLPASRSEEERDGDRLRTPATIPNGQFRSPAESQKQKKRVDKDFLRSVLEASVTKRDARAYMNKFVPLLERKGAISFQQQAAVNGSQTAPGNKSLEARAKHTQQEPLYIALVKIRAIEEIDDTTLLGIGRTLGQLQKLGLSSMVVVDSNISMHNESELRRFINLQASRMVMAIDSYDDPGARILDTPVAVRSFIEPRNERNNLEEIYISNYEDLLNTLREEVIPVIPSTGYVEDTGCFTVLDANDLVMALTKQFSSLQFQESFNRADKSFPYSMPVEIYRLILIDPVGGIPARNQATGRYMFLNLEQEFNALEKHLSGMEPRTLPHSKHHLRNAALAKNALSLLPVTSSVVITTPQEATINHQQQEDRLDWAFVTTRRSQNPLIHNLLTDKPVQSSSLPSGRFRPVVSLSGEPRLGSLTTLAKRGMPLAILPDPIETPWRRGSLIERRLSITDSKLCVDLPRLVHLIEDSFGRKLDVDDYLKRIKRNLAGIIIAGEYEGCAILTWEDPSIYEISGQSEPRKPVPYLDKFAVLRKSQGAGGVADIVFNAMVRDCFPDGVCWRSRKDNPVNKWYFERSRGATKLANSNWAMFWTTAGVAHDTERYLDYERVCRGVKPSWADRKEYAE